MTLKYHSLASVLSRHPLNGVAEFADVAARDAHVYTSSDIGKCVLTGTSTARQYWLIYNVSGGVGVFREIAAFDPAQYYGHSISSLTWTITANWTAFAGIPAAIVDSVQNRITRSGSDFTFENAGVYSWASWAGFVNGTTGKEFGMRLRDVAGAATKVNSGVFANANTVVANNMRGIFSATAGQVLQLQYITGAGGTVTAYSTSTLDGESLRHMQIAIERVG